MSLIPPHLAVLKEQPKADPEEPHIELPDDLFEALTALRSRRVPVALCTVTASSGSSPRKLGAKMLVLESGQSHGTIGGGAIEHEVIAKAVETLDTGIPLSLEHHLTHDLGMCCGGKMTVFIDPQRYPPRLLLFGAGHVAAPLCAVAATAGFEVSVFDARAEWATAARFPQAHAVQCDPFEDVQPTLNTDDNTFVVIVTHDHALDQAICESFLREPLAYLGVIGSVRKREKFKQRMLGAGFSKDEVARMHTPMGLDIGAVTPEEIAVSVVAELIAVRHGKANSAAASMTTLGKGYRPKSHEA